MTNPAQFGASKPGEKASGPLDCAAVEPWLAEAAEKILSPAVKEQLHAHAADCPACNEKLTRASRGWEWLLMLKQESLEPPADLVAKILARTSLTEVPMDRDIYPVSPSGDWRTYPPGVEDRRSQKPARGAKIALLATDADPIPSVPLWQRNSVVVLRRTVLGPRLALVAAMAFFSISLTMNLMGIRLGGLRAASLAPGSVRRTITRQYADANARVVRYYENLRVVYEVEARVQQIRRTSETTPVEKPENKPRKQSFNFNLGSRISAGEHRKRRKDTA
ncbi:MAG TPA: hypothetical protein VN670_09855 [Acidobacteriaceae bacterium]|nr:hypothetical protein [Acidobacteriaceae bacterium]